MNKFIKIGLIIPKVLAIFLLMLSLTCSCTKNEAVFEDNGVIEETISDTSSNEETITETDVSNDITEASNGQNNQGSESIDDMVEDGIISFKGNKVNGNTGIMVISINTLTGAVEGILQMGFRSFDMDRNSTKVCDYVLTGGIEGKLDLNTLIISGTLSGEAKTVTDTSGCNNYKVNYEIIGEVLNNYSIIKGYFETKAMDKYEFFLKVQE